MNSKSALVKALTSSSSFSLLALGNRSLNGSFCPAKQDQTTFACRRTKIGQLTGSTVVEFTV
jgi:hypothetical protein